MRKVSSEQITKFSVTFIFLMLFWLLFTFSLDPFSILLGGVFSFVISTVTFDLFVEGKDTMKARELPKVIIYLIIYFLVVVREIFVGSFRVVISVVTMNINPGLITIRTKLKSELARVFMANSITLTPGTVTVNLHEDHLTVHWLNKKTNQEHHAAKMIKGSFEKQLGRIFK